MGKIYVGQVLKIELDTDVYLAGAVAPIIRAWPPSGPPRDWSATVVGTELRYSTVKDVDLDIAGRWRAQAMPKIAGAEAPGETLRFTVHKLGY